MRNVVMVSWVGVWALAVFVGCGPGSSASGGACGNGSACGGDVVAQWTITSSCLSGNVSLFTADCPTSTSTSTFHLTGDVTYKADLTFSWNQIVSGSSTVTLPAACLTKQGVTQTCAQATQNLAADPTYKSASCTDAGAGSCRCALVFAEMASPRTGTYTTTAAGLLTETEMGNSVTTKDYCVQGKTLTESPHPDAVMNADAVTGTITLTKP